MYSLTKKLLQASLFLLPSLGFNQTQKKPNIIIILADDLGWGELGCYGQQKIPTPSLDKLAAQGMRFTQHYSGAPVCAPARCVLMTGRHLGHAEIRGNQQAKVKFPQFSEGKHPVSAAVAIPSLLLITAIFLFLAVREFNRTEVSYSAD